MTTAKPLARYRAIWRRARERLCSAELHHSRGRDPGVAVLAAAGHDVAWVRALGGRVGTARKICDAIVAREEFGSDWL